MNLQHLPGKPGNQGKVRQSKIDEEKWTKSGESQGIGERVYRKK